MAQSVLKKGKKRIFYFFFTAFNYLNLNVMSGGNKFYFYFTCKGVVHDLFNEIAS